MRKPKRKPAKLRDPKTGRFIRKHADPEPKLTEARIARVLGRLLGNRDPKIKIEAAKLGVTLLQRNSLPQEPVERRKLDFNRLSLSELLALRKLAAKAGGEVADEEQPPEPSWKADARRRAAMLEQQEEEPETPAVETAPEPPVQPDRSRRS